ncbi:hypothetical protein AJ80_03317 [Polytolypa hystricis UAMH7299]|uniref:Uncharacterized protein n=1 Tax=Polytolypa hystricis (strain UAMH7299) TaxID=1447883 RepID=A0A2B7YJP7_POLH7|nr:hypothetical protein AJ80_03317 [Polytolypa hystricis UAMH7299]
MAERKMTLTADEFRKGLQVLDDEMGEDPFITAFAPIKVIAAGGYIAVAHLQCRDSTDDIDYLLEPQWVGDPDIQPPFRNAVLHVAEKLRFNDRWMNEDMAHYVAKGARRYLFRSAEQQNIVLFQGTNLIMLAAPMEWVLERKLRRIYSGARGKRRDEDVVDAVALLKHLRDQAGQPLDRVRVSQLTIVNAWDVMPDMSTMNLVEDRYRRTYNEDIFINPR